MKIQWLLGLALCASMGAQAQQSDESVTVPAPRLSIDLPDHRYHMDDWQMRQFRGSYTLDNGQTLHLRGGGTAVYGEIDELGPHRMVAIRPNTFVALDRKLQVRIDFDQNDDAGGEVLMAVPQRNLASGEITEQVVRLATR
jgi:hypothetical protein